MSSIQSPRGPNVIDRVFGPEGYLAQAFPAYQQRDGQITMSREVLGTLCNKGTLLVEAPCGVGKSVSYLVPAIFTALRTRTPVIIATAGIVLQEQLLNKDLPMLQKVLPRDFTGGVRRRAPHIWVHHSVYDSEVVALLKVKDEGAEVFRGGVKFSIRDDGNIIVPVDLSPEEHVGLTRVWVE